MAIDFPNSPTTNQTYTVGSKTWTYDGEKWVISGTAGMVLDDLGDTTITTPAEFQSLVYDGTAWVNSYASTVTYVRNAESTTLTTGTVVYLFGATGDHATVKRADKSSDTTSSKTVGIVAAPIAASQNGPVVTRGYVDGINLSTGYASGDILWLNTSGGFTKTKPSAPDHLVFVGVVVRATNNGIVYVATQNGYELDELHNVQASAPNPGDFLKYNGSLWVNDAIDLGTDTTGDYMVDIVAGTGVTVVHTPSEGSSPTISIGQSVGTTDNPTFAGVTADQLTLGVLGGGNISTVSGDTTITVKPASKSGASITASDVALQGGDATGTTGYIYAGNISLVGGYATATSGSSEGGDIAIIGGTATSSGAPSIGGNVVINSGSGQSSNGFIAIGKLHPTSIEVGNSEGTLTVDGAVTLYGNLTANGSFSVQQIREKVTDSTITSNVMTCNYETGAIFYQGTAPSANFTLNVTNLPTDNGHAITVSVFVTQGSTGYYPNVLQIAGVGQTIKWSGGNAPTPTSSSGKIDLFTFTLIRRSSAWTVLGSANLNY